MVRVSRWGVLAVVVVVLVALSALPASAHTSGRSAGVAPIRHVFVITLENQSYAGTFGDPAADPYLAQVLPAQGALLTNYYATGHESNDNYLAMVSGQGPNLQTQLDCQLYDDFLGTGPLVPPGQALGTGCVYPSSVPTVANQLTSAGLTWKGYMEDMGNVAGRESPVCGHPALNTPGPHPVGRGRRRLRHPPRPVRLLPRHHRRHRLLRRPRRPPRDPGRRPAGGRACGDHRPGHRPPLGRHHPQPVLRGAQPVQRRPRLSRASTSRRGRARWPTSTASCPPGCR